jgi:hypothetical protein
MYFLFAPLTEASLDLFVSGTANRMLCSAYRCGVRADTASARQAEAQAHIVRVIQSHPQHSIRLALDTLGKEDLLVCIATQCETLVRHRTNLCLSAVSATYLLATSTALSASHTSVLLQSRRLSLFSRALQVCVTEERLACLALLGYDTSLFTTNPADARVVVVPRWAVSDERCAFRDCVVVLCTFAEVIVKRKILTV